MEDTSFEEHMDAVKYVNDFIDRMGGDHFAYDEERIDREVKNWPKDVQDAWAVAKDWNDSEEIY